jgi:hypothetical protein
VPRRFARPALVLLAQGALVGPTRDAGFVGDAWVYLAHLREGLWSTLTQPIGYHWTPVACVWLALIRFVFGESALVFQALNVLQLLSVGYLTYALGRRLMRDHGTPLLASLLYLGSATHYEASYWPLAGNIHLLGAQFYMLAVIVAYDHGAGRFPRSGQWLLGALALAAVFSHPAMVTVVGVGAVTVWLVRRAHGNAPPAWSWLLKALGPLAAVGLLFVVDRVIVDTILAARLRAVPGPSLDPMRFYYLATGTAGMLTLRGSYVTTHSLMTLGSGTTFDTPWVWVFVAGWNLALLAVAALCFRLARTVGMRVLAVFLVLHVVGVGLGGGLSSRQMILAQVPVALLLAWTLRAAANRLAAWIGMGPTTALLRVAPAMVALVLMLAARTDHLTGARLALRAGDTARALSRTIADLAPAGGPPVTLTLINMPSHYVERGLGAIVFGNGPQEIARLASRSVIRVDLRRLATPNVADFVRADPPITAEELRDRAQDPRYLVLVFQTHTLAFKHVDLSTVKRVLAGC